MKKEEISKTQLSANERTMIFFTSWQILQYNSGRVKEFVKLYESRKPFYDKVIVNLKVKDMKEYGILEKQDFLAINKILLSYEDEMTYEWLKEELLKQITTEIKKLVTDYAPTLYQENVGQRYANEISYKLWYFDKFINADKSIDIIKEIEDSKNIVFKTDGAIKTKILYDIMAHQSCDALETDKKRIKNETYVASCKYGEEAREYLKFMLDSHLLFEENSALEGYMIPIENELFAGYGLFERMERWEKYMCVKNAPKERESIEKEDLSEEPFVGSSPYSHFTKEKPLVAKNPKIRSMMKEFIENERNSFEQERKLEAMFIKESVAEVSFQMMIRNIDRHYITHRLRNMKFTEQMKERIINIAFLKVKHYGLGVTDKELEEDAFARHILISTAISEFYNTVFSSFEDVVFSKISKDEKSEVSKKNKKSKDLQSTFDKTLEEKNKEIAMLKEKLENLNSLEKDNRELKKKVRKLEYEINQQNEEEKEEPKEEIKEEIIEKEEVVPKKELTDSEFRELIRGRKILVWGVRESDARQLQPYKEIKCFVTKKGSKNIERTQLKSYDAVVICTNHSNHSMYWKVRDMVKAAEIPCYHMRKTDSHISKYKNAIISLCENLQNTVDC